MEQQLLDIRDQQKATWNKFSGGWKKWNDITMDWLEPMGLEIIRMLDLKEDDKVLDIAAGTGEPGLTIAGIVKKGSVVITDLAEDMLTAAKEKAEALNLKNIETKVCDVSELPFDDNSFDAISCRFGYMFFPDMQLATREMVRVLKPGGKLATSVWAAPDKNFWITAIMGTLNKNMELPAAVPGAPGMFRCAASGFIASLFKDAGLKNISETEINGSLKVGTPDGYWKFMNEVAAPVVSAMSKADADTKEKIRKEVHELVSKKYPGENIGIHSAALVIGGEK